MNKALIVFKGNHTLEQSLSTASSSWDAIGLGNQCPGCTVNSFAAQGYMECKAETNNFQAIRDAYMGQVCLVLRTSCARSDCIQGLVFSITGHGLGGMHSQIASADFNTQQIAYYRCADRSLRFASCSSRRSHAYGAPRVFNQAGATFYNNVRRMNCGPRISHIRPQRFNGEAGERGIFNNDQYTEFIPEGPNYTHAGTVRCPLGSLGQGLTPCSPSTTTA